MEDYIFFLSLPSIVFIFSLNALLKCFETQYSRVVLLFLKIKWNLILGKMSFVSSLLSH